MKNGKLSAVQHIKVLFCSLQIGCTNMFKTSILTCSVGLLVATFLYLQQDQSGATDTQKVTSVQKMNSEQEFPAADSEPDDLINTQSGLVAYVSPQTGELSPQPLTKKELAQASSLSQKDDELPPIKYTRYENGMIRADLNGHFMVPQTATVNCNGELHTTHSERPIAADKCVDK